MCIDNNNKKIKVINIKMTTLVVIIIYLFIYFLKFYIAYKNLCVRQCPHTSINILNGKIGTPSDRNDVENIIIQKSANNLRTFGIKDKDSNLEIEFELTFFQYLVIGISN